LEENKIGEAIGHLSSMVEAVENAGVERSFLEPPLNTEVDSMPKTLLPWLTSIALGDQLRDYRSSEEAGEAADKITRYLNEWDHYIRDTLRKWWERNDEMEREQGNKVEKDKDNARQVVQEYNKKEGKDQKQEGNAEEEKEEDEKKAESTTGEGEVDLEKGLLRENSGMSNSA
jgi:hypothetical protein